MERPIPLPSPHSMLRAAEPGLAPPTASRPTHPCDNPRRKAPRQLPLVGGHLSFSRVQLQHRRGDREATTASPPALRATPPPSREACPTSPVGGEARRTRFRPA